MALAAMTAPRWPVVRTLRDSLCILAIRNVSQRLQKKMSASSDKLVKT